MEAQRTIDAWRAILIESNGRGASKTTLTRLQANGVIEDLFSGPINLKPK